MTPPDLLSEAKARAEVYAIDAIVRALDAARQSAGKTKVQLAKAVGAPPETVRRVVHCQEADDALPSCSESTVSKGALAATRGTMST